MGWDSFSLPVADEYRQKETWHSDELNSSGFFDASRCGFRIFRQHDPGRCVVAGFLQAIMYRLSRLVLMVAVILGMYSMAILMWLGWPWAPLVFSFLLFVKSTQAGYKRLITLGSARWADETDLRRAGMLGAKAGLILGRLP